MKPHPRNARIQGSALRPNRFIFGDALDEQGLEPCEYLVHTEEPRFVCRLVGNDETPFDEAAKRGFASAVLFDESENASIYVCNQGVRLYDFTFSAEPPTAAELQTICDEAMGLYVRLQAIYSERELGADLREMRVIASKPLTPAERTAAVTELKLLAHEASQQPVSRLRLTALVQQALSGGDQAVLTEAQLALQSDPSAREVLLQTARDCIAFPEVVRKDGSILSLELWGLPFIFSRTEGGVWWHFPLLERVEPVLSEALELPAKSVLWVSPTLFTSDMLNERSCQDLVHLAPVMDAGCDYAPVDPVDARATFDAARQTHDPQLLVAFIPFLVERGSLEPGQARRRGRKALEAVISLVQDALGAEMEYGEAELYAPMPWWDALEAGINGMNRKRLGLSLALTAAQVGSYAGLQAEAEYQPELQGYEVVLRQTATDTVLARSVWLLVSDVAPDRERAWNTLSGCMREAGINLTERSARLH